MSRNLVIVESPAKAKTIQGFLGNDFIVQSSFGHIRDLPSKGMSIDIDNGFKPIYEIPSDKKKIVSELKKLSKKTEVWLATDEDREGEAIAWHLANVLSLDPKKSKRIVFHEITKTAISHAIDNPRTIDLNLVNAQQARRVLDRIVGYELSPVLWKKIKTGLSAGRVQSVAVRLIVEREREITDWTSEKKFKVSSTFLNSAGDKIEADLNDKLNDAEEVTEFLNAISSSTFKVSSVESKKGTRQPSPPFTTSSLQQEAARKLGYSVSKTMLVAQKLYESGEITYMRTDSTLLSNQALKGAEEYIKSNFSPNYHRFVQYKTKNASAQESHEAIRPTNFTKTSINTSDENLNKLYRLIWQRTVASQMSPAVIDKTEVKIDISDNEKYFIGVGEILTFKGFLEIYNDKVNNKILPNISVGEILTFEEINATENLSKSPARYSEASLVKKLESLGIGRPSTYAPTISTIQRRGYVEKTNLVGQEVNINKITLKPDKSISQSNEKVTIGADKNKLVPTAIAYVTTDFLIKHFKNIVSYKFTADIEEEFDKIATGKDDWVKIIDDFYKNFHPLIKDSENISRKDASQARLIGVDPKTNKNIYARYGKFGPMLQKGENEDDEKPDFAPLPNGSTLETVDLTMALKSFELPRTVGKTPDNEEIIANIGRFGPYIKIGNQFISIKPLDPHSITLSEALKAYEDKKSKDQAKNIKIFNDDLKILNGPYGPYITNGKKNARIPKSLDATKINEKEAKELLDKAPDKKRRFNKRKTSK